MRPTACLTHALRLAALALGLAAAPALGQEPRAAAEPACPPAAQVPTPEQIAQAQREATDRGLLWRVRKGSHDSYLYGTLHVGRLAWTMPGPQLVAAIRATNVLAMELDITDPGTLQQLARATEEASPPALPAALAQRLAAQRSAACVPPGTLDRMHPVMQAVSLAVLNARWEGMDPAFAQEAALGGMARYLHRPIVALESVQTQRDALVPAEPAAMLQALESALVQLENPASRQVMRRLGQAWAEGRLAELESYEQWCECMGSDAERALMHRMLDQRNPGLADRIDTLHQQGQRVLAAVGALHMVGPRGLPALLQQRGYQVQRLFPPAP